MSLQLAIVIIVVLDVALLAFLAWMMCHPRHLTPHVSANDAAIQGVPEQQRFTPAAAGPPHADTRTITVVHLD
jgi:hypothetical protein